MYDLWGFLLQTLTASGVALLLLAIKALFKDKLPPKWQFAVWGVLGVILLIPAGWNGRYTLIHWQVVVELIKGAVGDYSFSQVYFPIPMLTGIPTTVIEKRHEQTPLRILSPTMPGGGPGPCGQGAGPSGGRRGASASHHGDGSLLR